MAVGHAVVHNHGSSPAVIERVRVNGASPRLPVEGYYAADGKRRLRGANEDWPLPRRWYPKGSVHPAVGAVVPSLKSPEGKSGVEILVLLAFRRPGRYSYESVKVGYRVGDDRYTVDIPFAFTACARKSRGYTGVPCKPL